MYRKESDPCILIGLNHERAGKILFASKSFEKISHFKGTKMKLAQVLG